MNNMLFYLNFHHRKNLHHRQKDMIYNYLLHSNYMNQLLNQLYSTNHFSFRLLLLYLQRQILIQLLNSLFLVLIYNIVLLLQYKVNLAQVLVPVHYNTNVQLVLSHYYHYTLCIRYIQCHYNTNLQNTNIHFSMAYIEYLIYYLQLLSCHFYGGSTV